MKMSSSAKKPISRRQACRLLFGSATLALTAPSGPAAGGTPIPGTGTAAGKTAKRGGTLKLAHGSDILSFEPSQFAGGNWPMFNQVYNVCVRLDDNLNPQPELAESWQFSGDYRRLTLKLRQGVKFHSGREFTAEDVVYNIKRILDPKLAANALTLAQAFKTVEVRDKYTVVCGFDSYYAPALDLFDMLFIIDREAEATLKRKGVGTGPFKVESWQPGEYVRLVRNENYWRQGLPYLDEIIIRAMPDEQTMVIALGSGDIDVAEAPPAREWVRMQKAGKMKTLMGPMATMLDLAMNVGKPPLSNKKVRQAIAKALDRQRYIDLFLAGASAPQCVTYPPNSLGYDEQQNKSCMPDFDLKKAKSLLSEAGYPNGFDVQILTSVPGFSPYSKEIAEKLQADLKEIGIRATITHFEQAEARRRWFAKEFELGVHQGGRFQRDPATMFRATIFWPPDSNVMNFQSAEYTNLVKEAESESDSKKRHELYKKINAIVLDELWLVPLFPLYRLFALQPYVQGLSWNVEGQEILETVWLDR